MYQHSLDNACSRTKGEDAFVNSMLNIFLIRYFKAWFTTSRTVKHTFLEKSEVLYLLEVPV